MAKFRSLTDVIQAQIKATVQKITVPIGSPMAVTFNMAKPTLLVPVPVNKVLRWGNSTWGVEPVIDSEFPQG